MGIISLLGPSSLSGQAPSREALESALHALDSGSVVAVPTDTGYALVADVSYTSAADRLFSLTRRTREYELSLLVADAEQALSVSVGVTVAAERLMEKTWPGAVTLVLPRNPDFVADLGSDEETVGVRCPDHLVPRLLCDEVGPLATVGACMHGTPTATTAQQVQAVFGERVSVILDAGEQAARASTVVDVTGNDPKLLREGSVLWEDIMSALG